MTKDKRLRYRSLIVSFGLAAACNAVIDFAGADGAGDGTSQRACAQGQHDDGTGECVASGCAPGYHDGGDGVCVTAGVCATGYHDGGDGSCVAVGACANGYHDGGDGRCVTLGSCSHGYHDGGGGSCVADGTCLGGYHDDGTGACVALGCSAASGYHAGGDGACLSDGTCTCLQTGCSPNFHDDGTGRCLASGCALDHHDDGSGVCVASGCNAGAGYHAGGDGTCLDSGTCACVTQGSCSAGFHDDGTGGCVASGCNAGSGYHPGGAGTCLGDGTCACVANGTCSAGYHDDGTGSCVVAGCNTDSGYHAGGDGTCLEDATCACLPSGNCSYGFHDDGTGKCVASGCDSSYHDDGTGAHCVASGCAGGYHPGGSGTCLQAHTCACLQSGCSTGYHDGGDGACVANGACSSGYHSAGADCVANAVSVAAAAADTCVLTSVGGVKCWGNNTYGQVGNGTTAGAYSAVDVIGLTSGAIAVSVAAGHSCAVMSGGSVRCWGHNNFGQLGDGTTTDSSTPVSVSGLASGVTAIAAGGDYNNGDFDNLSGFSCARTSGGGVKCWGRNNSGQLGNGTTSDALTPLGVTSLSSGVLAISAGSAHACAVTAANVKCWGANGDAQLGDGTVNDSHTPVNVAGLSPGASCVAAGFLHTCAVTSAGGVECWGWDGYCQLGSCTDTEPCISPSYVTNLTTGASVVVAGMGDSCALASGGAKCWGFNLWGQLGIGSADGGQHGAPSDVTGLTSGVVAIAVGWSHACAVTSGGKVKCWGTGGLLGDGTWVERNTPVDVIGF